MILILFPQVTLMLSVYGAIDCKKIDEKIEKTSPIKKANSSKPTKSPKSILDQFRNLSADDKEFLKELDKQFALHGDKIKFKVERENITKNASNKKRTIDGELGYSYNQDQYEHGYYFSSPKTQYNRQGLRYTNSQKEIATDIEIQPSQSYEVKPVEPNYQTAPRSQYIQQSHGYVEDNLPVIVLKIPGPTKYAAHLQALLQQYLELRAAQYIRAFEEQEAHQGYNYNYNSYPQQQNHQQHYVQPVQQQLYYPMVQVAPNLYTPVPIHQHSQYYTQPQPYTPVYYNHPSSAPYHNSQPTPQYHNHQQVQPQQQHVEYEPKYVEAPVESPQTPKEYYAPDITYANYDEGYQQEEQEPQQAVHESHLVHEQHTEDQYEDTSVVPLKTSENYPSDKHTQVIFKEDKIPYNPHYGNYLRKEDQVQVTAAPEFVEITQRPRTTPHNYHAHPDTAASEQHYETSKRQTAPYTEEMFKKYNKLIQRMKKRGSKLQQKAAATEEKSE
uniref:CSON009293 protein n=1 Tax=Culicoides sonorensis TaxID=179676 RepID=A0A336M2H5_CULSO